MDVSIPLLYLILLKIDQCYNDHGNNYIFAFLLHNQTLIIFIQRQNSHDLGYSSPKVESYYNVSYHATLININLNIHCSLDTPC